MKDVDEQFNHPQPVRHSDNEKSKLPQRAADAQRPKKNPKASRRSSDEGRRHAVQFARKH